MNEQELQEYTQWLMEVWNPNQLYIPFAVDAPKAYLKPENMQTSLFTGEELANQGIKKAVDHANRVTPKWAEMAYDCFLSYLGCCPSGYNFMAEDVRDFSTRHYPFMHDGLPEPPNLRAWGGIMRRVQRAGVIRAIGTRKVSNTKAHCANATLWIKK